MTDTTQSSGPRMSTREQTVQSPAGNGPVPPSTAEEPPKKPAEAAPAEAKKPEGPWIGKLPLRKAVNAHGDMVSELTFREPTGGDIADCGNPIVPGQTGRMQFDGPVMTEMMARLALVTPKTIRDLHPKDWTNGAYMIAGFFLPDM